ncbi:hypothetical protein RFI_00040 [Reticulomyxa filosa]|uniref:Uncharacterized protein n=1 Tax=Reticulomyxa filosa TaxID=46433 RepID=X6PH53_RETFI|nr:hypothetical protein RFI_00040 [Reticulomyxa filosa]|eukprot:ETO37022.1 hypothetical protein RFI_00040 [Reticulomyxa filosa]
MTEEKQNDLESQKLLEAKIQDLNSSEAVSLYYEKANDFVNSLLDKHKETAYYDKNCLFSRIYGVTLSGCVQKQLVIPNLSCGYLVFLYHLKEKYVARQNIDSLQKQHVGILKWVKQSIDKIKKELCTDKIKVLKHSKFSLKINWKGLEYHIAIAWTFSKRQYCEFHYTQSNVHVYPFSMEQLQSTANDLIEEAPTHKRHITNMAKQKQWKSFLEKNMSASLSLLRVYYMRESLVGKNTRLAVLFLKVWQRVVMNGKHHLSNNSLEIICVSLFHQLQADLDTPILALDIIRQFFKTMIQNIQSMHDGVNSVVIIEPYLQNQSECLVYPKDISHYKQKPGLEDFRNMETKFKTLRELFDGCEGALGIIDKKAISLIEFIFNSFSLFFFFLLLSPFSLQTRRHRQYTQKKKGGEEGKTDIKDVTLFARHQHSQGHKRDLSDEIAKKLMEQCFYNLKNKKIGSDKARNTRKIWEQEEKEAACSALDKFMDDMKVFCNNLEKETKKNKNELEYCSSSSYLSEHEGTITEITSCITENGLNIKWFTISEFYAVFSASSNRPDAQTCETIFRTAKHPKPRSEMFHKKGRPNGRVVDTCYYYCYPIQQCKVCNEC